ncbi:MAG: hypothetical protein R3F16_22545 [Myxococcota bacterium]
MIVIASILFMLSVGPLLAGGIMMISDQQLGTAFFDPTAAAIRSSGSTSSGSSVIPRSTSCSCRPSESWPRS